MVSADIRVTPADLISEDPEWVSMLSWQGGLDNERGLVVVPRADANGKYTPSA